MFLLGLSVSAIAAPDLSRCEPLDPKMLNGDKTGMTYRDVNDPASVVVIGTVETNHFTPQVEQLIKGQTAPLPRDIAFVLRQIPNHYRALAAMARWQLANGLPIDPDSNVWTVDCYFVRAITFRPNDSTVHLLYGTYLQRAKRFDEALAQYETAQKLGNESPDLYYNWGLLELDLNNLTKAKQYSDKVYQMGYPLPGLKEKLARAMARRSSSADAPKPP